MGLMDILFKQESINQNLILYFTDGELQRTEPEKVEDIYQCRYIVSDGINYDLENVSSIKSIAVPDFKIPDFSGQYEITRSLDYIIRKKAGIYFNDHRKDLCSACLWKSTELMLNNKWCAWRKQDFERLVIWHYELKMFSEGEKAKIYLEKNGVYDNVFDSLAVQIKNSIMQSAKKFNMDLVAFNDYATGCCPECAKMHGRVYSISGKNKKYPKLPEYVKIHGNFHNGCRCTMSSYFEEMEGVYHKGKIVNPIIASNRPWIDDRDEREVQLYQDYLKKVDKNRKEKKDREEYNILMQKLPNIIPKSFGAYRRMKNLKTKNFEKLIEAAKQAGIEIET